MDSMAYQIAEEQSDDLYNQSKWQLAYSVLLWTTIIAIKWCYFALLYPSYVEGIQCLLRILDLFLCRLLGLRHHWGAADRLYWGSLR